MVSSFFFPSRVFIRNFREMFLGLDCYVLLLVKKIKKGGNMKHIKPVAESADIMQYACRDCEDVITNPVCPGCLSRGIEQWALIWMPELLSHIQLNPAFGTGTRCIMCKRDMSQCAHCFSKEIYELVVRSIPELGEEFLQSFNFQLRETLN